MSNNDKLHSLDRAWSALEGNDPAQALDCLAQFTEDKSKAAEIEFVFGELILLQVLALLTLGDPKAARAALTVAEETIATQPAALRNELENDLDIVRASAEVLLSEWRIQEACDTFSRLLDGADHTEAAAYHERLALCNDLLGDFDTADAHMGTALGVAPLHVSEEEFETIVANAIENLPEPYRSTTDRIPIVIEPVPTRGLVATGGEPGATPPDLLGLFLGMPVGEPAAPGEAPASIRIFQRNLERVSSTTEELCAEIQVTLYHELGHALGLDEEGVAAIGLA